MEEKENQEGSNKPVLGCLLVIVGIGIAMFVGKPIINILGDGAYPIIMIGGILIAMFLSKMFYKNN